jgi:hypothetical protein
MGRRKERSCEKSEDGRLGAMTLRRMIVPHHACRGTGPRLPGLTQRSTIQLQSSNPLSEIQSDYIIGRICFEDYRHKAQYSSHCRNSMHASFFSVICEIC